MSRFILEIEESELMAGEMASVRLEKLVDGGFQHLYKKHHIVSPLYSEGYSDSRFLRALFREWLGSAQITLTTGAQDYNTKEWYYAGITAENRNLLCCTPQQLVSIRP